MFLKVSATSSTIFKRQQWYLRTTGFNLFTSQHIQTFKSDSCNHLSPRPQSSLLSKHKKRARLHPATNKMGAKQDAVSRRAIARRKQDLEKAHRLSTFGKRQKQYNRELLVGVLGHFGIRCTRKELRPQLMAKLIEYEESLAGESEEVIEAAETFVRDFVPGPTWHRILCVVCMEHRRSFQFPQHKVSNACQHPVEICNDCLEDHMASFFAEYVAATENPLLEKPNLECPLCDEELNAGHIREFGRPQDSER